MGMGTRAQAVSSGQWTGAVSSEGVGVQEDQGGGGRGGQCGLDTQEETTFAGVQAGQRYTWAEIKVVCLDVSGPALYGRISRRGKGAPGRGS